MTTPTARLIVVLLLAAAPIYATAQTERAPDLAAQVGVIHYAYAPPTTSSEILRDRALGSHNDVVEVYRILNEAGDWRSVDRQLRAFVQEEVGTARAARRAQTAGVAMLRTYLSGTEMDGERAEALGFYTRLLLDAGSPEAQDLSRALARLVPVWDASKVESAAGEAAAHADAYVARSVESGRVPSERLERLLDASGAPPQAVFEATILRTDAQLREGIVGAEG